MTSEEFIGRFSKEYMAYHQITPKRSVQVLRVLRLFADSLDGRALDEATQEDLQAFAGKLLDGGLHVNTVRGQLNMIRPAYSWAYAASVITAEQYLKLKSVRNPRGSSARTTPDPYTRNELIEFWATLDAKWRLLPTNGKGKGARAFKRWLTGKGPWGRVWRHAMRLQIEAMVRLALDCGLRSGEIFGLAVDDLHFDNEYIVVRGKADPTTGQPKVRSVPVTGAARQAVRDWLEFRALMRPGHDRPWVSCYGSARTKPMWRSRFEQLLQTTVGPQWRWHRFRHTAATSWLRAGADLEVVSALLGHSSLQQTLCYAEILKTDIAKKLGKVEAEFEALVSREVVENVAA